MLDLTNKPYYISMKDDVSLGSAFESSSAEVRKAALSEVFEVIGGPRKEPDQEMQRVKCTCTKDKKSGYLTFKEASGESSVESAKIMVCMQAVAITSSFDIVQGKSLRKLEKGETFEVIEEEKEDTERNMTRAKVKIAKDSLEGFITLKGNQGTTYAEESKKHYVVKKSLPLENGFSPGSKEVRQLEEGELFEVIDGPSKKTKEGENRVHCRSVVDGTEGWLTFKTGRVSSWSPSYKCVSATTINDKLEVADAKNLRKIVPGETLEALSAPSLEATANIIRVHVRAEKDGLAGYATVTGNAGTAFLECVV